MERITDDRMFERFAGASAVAGVAGGFAYAVAFVTILRGNVICYLALASGVMLVVIYLGRLIVLDPKSLVLLVAALLAGFIVDPIFYVWLGIELRRGERLHPLPEG